MPKTRVALWPWQWLGLSLSLALIDQYSKNWAIRCLPFQETRPLSSFLILYLCYNTGIGFSLLSNIGHLVLVTMSISFAWILKELFHLQKNTFPYSYLNAFGLSCILGGGLGNLYDRFRFGAIIDFLSIHSCSYKTPIFNLADIFIIIGLCFLMLASITASLNKDLS